MSVTLERAQELLDYDQQTGVFTRKVAVSGYLVGSVAGSWNSKGYRRMSVDGKIYMAHRLAWLFVYGRFPSSQIDHIDRDKGNNRISNLRLASQSQNFGNVPCQKNNTSGFRGVTKHRRRWRASICVNDKKIYIGLYATPEEAAAAYRMVAKAHFGEFFAP